MEWDEKPPFISNLKFYGDDYFPYGLGRCGEFTLSQVALLEVHGRAYEGLHLGTRERLQSRGADRHSIPEQCGTQKEPSKTRKLEYCHASA